MGHYKTIGTSEISITSKEALKITEEYLRNEIIGDSTFINTDGRLIWLIGFEGCMGTEDIGPASELQLAANKIIKHINKEA